MAERMGCTAKQWLYWLDDANDAWSELPGVALQPIDEAGDGRSSFKRRYEAIRGMVAVED